MFKKIAFAALATTILATSAPAFAMGGGGGGDGGMVPYARVNNPDGSWTSLRGRKDGSRVRTHVDRRGKKTVKVIKKRKKVRRVRPRTPPYAINHTDGIISIGVFPGIHFVFGGRP